jgi:tRNA(Ile)-lysidine synthase
LRTHLNRHPDLFPSGARVVVALSGGTDSTALLHLLHGLAADLDLRLEAAHFDHGVRAGSGTDAARAGDLARNLDVPFHGGRPETVPRVGQASLREARYRWLNEVVRTRAADRLAVGHHADDQAETVLFHIMRGTGLRGLAGIPARRGAIARPLLPFDRRELAGYLDALGVSPIDDPSNEDRRWARVRLRHEVIPALERAKPGTIQRLVALGDAAARALELSEHLAALLLTGAEVGPSRPGRLRLSRVRLLSGGPELMAIALRRVARDMGVALTVGGTRAAVTFMSEGRSGGRAMIGGGLEISREYDHVIIGQDARPAPVSAVVVHERAGKGCLRIGERALQVRWRPATGSGVLPERIAVAVSPGHYPLIFRGWERGDRIRLAGGTRKLKKLFGDRRIPVGARGRIPVLADRNGNILWIEGLATAERDSDVEGESSLLEFELRNE